MPNTKISDDPSASALAGTEIVPVIQGGVNKKTTIEDILNDRNVVTQDPATLALQVDGTTISVATSYTLAQFLVLDVGDYVNRTIEISDIPTPHSSVNGVLVRANAAGTGWIWVETPSLTQAQIAANSITAAMASGWRIFVSDIGPGCYMYSDGTRFRVAQSSVVLSAPILEPVVLTNAINIYTVAKQVEIPRIDGKSIWGDGDMLEVQQIANKTGELDVLNNCIYLGKNIVAVDAAETNTVITRGNFATARENNGSSLVQRILRKNSTTVRLMNANATVGVSGISTGVDAPDTTVTSLDSGPWYLDATLRCSTSTGDSALTLTNHYVILISSGAA
jgi:hypothetical protein